MIAAASLRAQDAAVSAERIREQTRFLSSDLMEGRGVGQRGGQLATEYIASQLALAGAKPAGDNGTYFQKVPLVGIETAPTATLSALGGGKGVEFRWLDDFVASSQTQQAETRFEADAVFVGHGITAPEWKWDDFKGVDVTGKIVVLFTNEPESKDLKFFDGPALTYYGRWTYKYEEALRRGARGAILIHTTPTASYGWDVVRNSWGRESPFVKLEPGGKALSLPGMDLAGGRRPAAGAGGKSRSTSCWRPPRSAISGRSTWGSGFGAICRRKSATWTRAMWRRSFRGAIPNSRMRWSSSARTGTTSGSARQSTATPSTTARSTTLPGAPCCWNWRAPGPRCRRSRDGRRCSWR